MTQQERDAILSEALSNLERAETQQQPPVSDDTPALPPDEAESPMDRWRREGEEFRARREARQQQAQHRPSLDAQLEELVRAERQFISDVIAGVVAQLKSDLLKEIDRKVGELRAEVSVSRAVESGKVTDLPNFLSKRAAS